MEFRELNKKEMGARIRARREALNMSRSELGKLLSVTVSSSRISSTATRVYR